MIEANHDLFSPARDWASQQIGFCQDRLAQFGFGWKLLGPALLFVSGVACVEEGRYVIVSKNRCEFFVLQRLARIVAFDELDIGLLSKFAQETPGVATRRSSSFAPKVNHIQDES